MIELLLILAISFAARDDAARDVDQAVDSYLQAIASRPAEVVRRRDDLFAKQIALRAILERERILEIGIAEEEELKAHVPVMRAQRDAWLARRTVTEREQQAAIASALVTTSTEP